MHRTLFHIPPEIFGVPTFGVGWLLAVWVIFSLGLLVWQGRRQGWNAETWGYLLLLVPVAAVIVWLLPVLVVPGRGLPIRGYGVMMLLAILSATTLTWWRGRRVGLDSDLVVSLAFWMLIPGIIGARTLYVIEYWSTDYAPRFQDGLGAGIAAVLRVDQGGLVVYGSLIGGVLGLLLFVRRHRLPLLATCDLIAPGLMLGLAFGRIGCLLNGCCFGGVCDPGVPWAVTFPGESPPYRAQLLRGDLYGFTLAADRDEPVVARVDPRSPAARAGLQQGQRLKALGGYDVNSDAEALWVLEHPRPDQEELAIEVAGGRRFRVPIRHRSLPVHPTQVYSALNALVLCLLLLAYDPFRRRDGELIALLLTIYPLARFLLEIIRHDETAIFGTGLSISQNFSLVLLAVIAALWFYVLRQPRAKAFTPTSNPR